MPSPAPPTWAVVVPVKRLELAKSRLTPYGPAQRGELALAFALDAVAAALACPSVSGVTVVTDDRRAGAALRALGADLLPEDPGRGLDAALLHGAVRAATRHPGSGTAAMTADLPALRARHLADVLDRAVARPFFVADAVGRGTTLLAAPPGLLLRPQFGPGSAARHRADGASPVDAAPGLRRDVDTAVDLVEALRLGVGPHTRAVAGRLGGEAVCEAAHGSVAAVQATVRSFDEATRSGTVLTDDGVEHPYDAAAYDDRRLRRLRVGQRVRLTLDGSGRVTGLTLSTFD